MISKLAGSNVEGSLLSSLHSAPTLSQNEHLGFLLSHLVLLALHTAQAFTARLRGYAAPARAEVEALRLRFGGREAVSLGAEAAALSAPSTAMLPPETRLGVTTGLESGGEQLSGVAILARASLWDESRAAFSISRVCGGLEDRVCLDHHGGSSLLPRILRVREAPVGGPDS